MQQYTFSARDKVIITAKGPQPLINEYTGKESPPNSSDDHEVAVYVEKGLISGINIIPAGTERISSEEWQQIHLPGDWLLSPPLIDCHVHLAADGINGFKGITKPVEENILKERLNLLSSAGIGAVRDGGDRFNISLKAAGLSSKLCNEMFSPQVVATGSAIFRRGFYGKFLGQEGIDHVEEAEKIIQDLKERGAQQVKVILSGLVDINNPGKAGAVQFSQSELKQIVNKSVKCGLPVMAHVNSDQGVRLAVEAGVHTVEHGYFISDDTLRLMVKNGVGWVPTLAPLSALLKTSQGELSDKVQQILNNHIEKIATAVGFGVKVGLGTDAGAPGVTFNGGLHEEMKLLAASGLRPLEIFFAATTIGSEILGINKKRGKIAPGKEPHFIAINRDALLNILNLTTPEAVFYSTT